MRSPHKREASDWAGCLVCLGLVALSIYRMPRASVVVVLLVLPDLLRAAAFLIRGQKFASLPGLWPKFASYAGSFSALTLIVLFSHFRPEWTARSGGPVGTLGLLLIFAASLIEPWAVWHLRYSFSVEPQARALVTRGPYGISRHPIYVLGFLQMLGFWIGHRTAVVAVIMLIT